VGIKLHGSISASRSRSRNVGLLVFSAVAAASNVKWNSLSSAVYRSSGVDHSSDALENNAELEEKALVFTVASFLVSGFRSIPYGIVLLGDTFPKQRGVAGITHTLLHPFVGRMGSWNVTRAV
jgi:hypothetical protein